MQHIKTVLALILVFTLIVVAVFVAVNRGILPESTISNSPLKQLPKIIPVLASLAPKNNNLGTSITSATQNLTTQTASVGSQVGNVLGSATQAKPLSPFIQVNSTATNSAEGIAGQSLEYARYLYCQNVVQEWEKNH